MTHEEQKQAYRFATHEDVIAAHRRGETIPASVAQAVAIRCAEGAYEGYIMSGMDEFGAEDEMTQFFGSILSDYDNAGVQHEC